MIIKRIKIRNYKTYLDLDLDLSVKADQPIILIGGMNGGGKTTLFEAICGALYGLKIQNKAHFQELLNNGAMVAIVAAMLEEKTEFVQTYFNNPDFQNFVNARVYQAAVSQLR